MALYRILVVDDDLDLMQAVAATLRAADYEVATAKDGWDGLAQARRLRPDLVLLDVTMPQMDGWTFMKFVRAHQDLAAIPVIFLTGSTSAADRERGMRLGAAAYMPKPVEPERLLSEVASVLDRRGAAPAEIRGTDLRSTGEKNRLRMSGRTEQMSLIALLSILGAGERTGVLEVMKGPAGDRGRILLRKGRVASARVEGLRNATGLDAVEALGKWRDGAFTFVEEEMLIGEDASAAVPRL
ncbi:MAG TPA: response regulator [Planctomycetota bacterium]|nr:response regulator [Planctomycetota bacterium]